MSDKPLIPVTYLLVWLALVVLALATAFSAYIPMGPLNTVANVGIALAKMLLVMIFFMHLKARGGVMRLVAASGFFWLLLLIGIILSDYLTRPVIVPPW